jgi:thioredoxin 1
VAGKHILTVDDSNFETEVLNSDVPILIDFWAQWCAPCIMVAPVLEELAQEYQGRAKIGKVNVDYAGGLASQFGIHSIPTVIVFDKGKPVQQMIGARTKRDYAALIEARLVG